MGSIYTKYEGASNNHKQQISAPTISGLNRIRDEDLTRCTTCTKLLPQLGLKKRKVKVHEVGCCLNGIKMERVRDEDLA